MVPGFGRFGRFGRLRRADGELLDHRIGQQFACQLGHPRERGLVGGLAGLAEFDLEPLALADANHLVKAEAVARAGDRLALRIVDLRLEHHLNDNSGHGPQRTPAADRLDPQAAGSTCGEGIQ